MKKHMSPDAARGLIDRHQGRLVHAYWREWPGPRIWYGRYQAASRDLFQALAAALKELAPDHGEIKSMRTHPDHLGKGAGAAMLDYIMGVARERGYKRISLETGSTPTFVPAIALYKKRGFKNGDSFAGYAASDFNQFFHLDL